MRNGYLNSISIAHTRFAINRFFYERRIDRMNIESEETVIAGKICWFLCLSRCLVRNQRLHWIARVNDASGGSRTGGKRKRKEKRLVEKREKVKPYRRFVYFSLRSDKEDVMRRLWRNNKSRYVPISPRICIFLPIYRV